MNLRYATKALIDMDAIAEIIQSSSSRAALRFIEATEKTAQRLIEFPEIGAIFESDDPELQDFRVCLISDFEKYLMFYRIEGKSVVVRRIIHGHRNLIPALKE